MNKWLVTCMLLLLGITAQAQQVPPVGEFLVDSMKIGEPVPYSISFTYESQYDAVFPDSLFNFQPFEIDHKDYFPTRTAAGLSYDSAVYYLSYFEIDSVQVYALPVLLVENGDSTRYSAAADTIYLKQLVTEVPDSVAIEALALRENTNPAIMDLAVNYPYIFIGTGIFILLVGIGLAVFGKKLMTYIKMVRLKRKHQRFMQSFDEIASTTSLAAIEKSEKLIILWKKYLQHLEKYPYTTLTTQEVVARIPKDKLTTALAAVDATMYSPRHPDISHSDLAVLKEFASERFRRELIKVKNRE